MKLRLKLNSAWSRPLLPPGDRGIYLLSLGVLRRGPHGWQLELAWKRAALALFTVAVAGYLLLVTALWSWLKRTPHNQVNWVALATAPVRWEAFRAKRGDTSIAQGLEQLRQRQFGDAYFNLTAGLARSPANSRGRVALAMLQAGGEPTQAITTLEAGLKYDPSDLELLRTLVMLYRQQQAGTRLLATADDLLARQPPVSAGARQVIGLAAAVQRAQQGDDKRALATLAQIAPTGDAQQDGRSAALRVELLARLGRADEARQFLAALPADAPAAARAHAEASLALAAADEDSFERALRRWLAAAPQEPTPYIFAIQGWHQLKRSTLRSRAEMNFFALFGRNDQALQMLAATAVNLDLPDIVQRCLEHAEAARLSGFAFRVHLTEIALRRGDFDAAFRLLRAWEKTVETLAVGQRVYPEFIARLTRLTVGGGDSQDDPLLAHLAAMRGRANASMYLLAGTVLEKAGRLDAAVSVVRLGAQFYPYSDGLGDLSRRLAAAQSAAAPAIAARATERPAAPVTSANAETAWRDIDAAFEREEFTRVRDLLRAVRSARPEWLNGAAERELALRDIRLAILTQEPAAARSVVRSQLDNFRVGDDALRIVELARSLLAAGRDTEARVLRDEVLARYGTNATVAAAARALALTDDLAPLLASAAAAQTAIDDALKRGRADDALRALDYVRKQVPEWLESARTELTIREVRARLALRQRPLAFTALKEIVVRPGAPRAGAFRLVREMIASGEGEWALQVAREIVRLLPEDPAAAKLLKEAEAPRPAS